MQGDDARKQTTELLDLVVDLNRKWFPDNQQADHKVDSQKRVVRDLKSQVDSSKFLGEITGDNTVSSLLHSHWSRSNKACLSLVEKIGVAGASNFMP